MKKLLLILLCLPMIGFGQGWEKVYGTPTLFSSGQQSIDGNYVVYGSQFDTTTWSGSDIIIKLDLNGNVQWSNSFSNGAGLSICQTQDSGYIMASLLDGLYYYNDSIILIKSNSNGILQWIKHFSAGDQEFGMGSIRQCNDLGYIFINGTDSTGSSLVTKTDSLGNLSWTYSPNNGIGIWTSLNSIEQTSDGGYILSAIYRTAGVEDFI
jgi:hypothetical protein